MTDRFVLEHIKALQPYEPVIPPDAVARHLNIPICKIIKLDANENPYGMPPRARWRLANLATGHIYPDPECRQLRLMLSDVINISQDNIIIGAGADELIDLVVRLTLKPGDRLMDCPPTFGFYRSVSQIHNLTHVEITRHADFSLDIDNIRAAVNQGAKAIFLANPNNPDGSVAPYELLCEILELPILVILDEAYIHFASSTIDMAKMATVRDNLIVLRTFSKWGGLAGLRLGYGIFPKYLQNALMKIKPPYNVSTAASEAGIGALESLDQLNQQRDWIIKERDRLFNALQTLDWLSPYPSQANFILCRVSGLEAVQVKNKLLEQGIMIRYFNKPGLQDHIRISIGTPSDIDRLLEALKEIKV